MPPNVLRFVGLSMHHCRALRHSPRTSTAGKLCRYSATLASVRGHSVGPLPTHGKTMMTSDPSEDCFESPEGGGSGQTSEGGICSVLSCPVLSCSPAFSGESRKFPAISGDESKKIHPTSFEARTSIALSNTSDLHPVLSARSTLFRGPSSSARIPRFGHRDAT